MVACNSVATGVVADAATKFVSLNKTSLKLAVNKTAKLQVKKKGGVKVKSTTFKSNNAKVASVTKKGVVTAKAEGTAKITVKVKFKKGKKSGSSTLIAKVTVGGAQASATPTVFIPTNQSSSQTTQTTTKATVTPNAASGASATAKVTATSTPKATKAPQATEDPFGEDPEETDVPKKTTKPTKAPQATEDPWGEDLEETDGPVKTPKPNQDPEEGYYDDFNECWTAAGVYDEEDTDDAFLSEYYCGLVQSWSELIANKVITVSGNKITKVDADKIEGRILILPEDIKEIGDNAFAGCTKLVWIDGQTTAYQLDKIGKKAFSNCTNLMKLHVKSNEIGDEAFFGCSGLTYYVDLKYADVIGKKAFSGCSLSEVRYLGATKIGAGAFDTEDMTIGLDYKEIPEGYEEGWFAPDKNITVYNSDKEVLNQ